MDDRPLPDQRPDRRARFKDGLLSVVRSLWFFFSFLLYGIGLVFLYLGRGLIILSRWETPPSATTFPGARPPAPPGRGRQSTRPPTSRPLPPPPAMRIAPCRPTIPSSA